MEGYLGIVETCVEMIHAHPEPIVQAVSLLWSINERLAGNAGIDIEKPSQDWLVDLFKVVRSRADREDAERDARNRQEVEKWQTEANL